MKKYQSQFNPRQYMVSKDFEIFYYDDTNFSNVKSHTHDYYEFYFFLQGEIDLMVSGRAFPMKAPESGNQAYLVQHLYSKGKSSA